MKEDWQPAHHGVSQKIFLDNAPLVWLEDSGYWVPEYLLLRLEWQDDDHMPLTRWELICARNGKTRNVKRLLFEDVPNWIQELVGRARDKFFVPPNKEE